MGLLVLGHSLGSGQPAALAAIHAAQAQARRIAVGLHQETLIVLIVKEMPPILGRFTFYG